LWLHRAVSPFQQQQFAENEITAKVYTVGATAMVAESQLHNTALVNNPEE
jgi:hypothetical protein